MTDSAPCQPLLCDALVVLALPVDEQIRVNGPGCVACDLLNDFDHAHIVAVATHPHFVDEQRRILEVINKAMQSMQGEDYECFNNEVLRRPVWQRLRELAAEGLRAFGWESALVEPFVEVEPGVWRRPSSIAEKIIGD